MGRLGPFRRNAGHRRSARGCIRPSASGQDLELALGQFTGITPRLTSWDDALAVLLDLRSGSSKRIELDLAAVEIATRGSRRVCAIGEVKSGQEPTGIAELERLDAAVTLLPDSPVEPRRLLVSRAGFTRELTQAARRRGDTELVDMPRLYRADA